LYQLIVDQQFFRFSKSKPGLAPYTSSVVCFDTSFWPVSVQGTDPMRVGLLFCRFGAQHTFLGFSVLFWRNLANFVRS
jgi:hypothetical protein